MFGYIKTDFSHLYVKDVVLYKATYCSLCKSIGACLGNCGRFTLSYDLSFFNILIHSLLNIDVKIEKHRCIAHWLRKRPIANPDEISKRMGCLNVILAHYKCYDDIIDCNKGRAKSLFIEGAYKKAKKIEPVFDEIVKNIYSEILRLEKGNCDSIDMISDCFARLFQKIGECFFKEEVKDYIKNLFYNLGKWIYLIDALDDYDKDIKKKTYNVFVNIYKFVDKKTFIKEKYCEIEGIFASILSDIANSAQQIEYKYNHDLVDNVLYRGLLMQTKNILEDKKCSTITKF